MKTKDKTCYSQTELNEFKTILEEKLRTARQDLKDLVGSPIPIESSSKMYEAAAVHSQKEMNQTLAGRQQRLIADLEAALVRIENKTYGICKKTGTLIPKERLRAVPHTTMCMESKLQANHTPAAAA